MRRTSCQGHGSLLHETWKWHPIAVCIKHTWNVWFWYEREVEMLSWAEQCNLPVLKIKLSFLEFFSLFSLVLAMPPSSFIFMHISYIPIFPGIEREQKNFRYWQAFRYSYSPVFLDLSKPFCLPVFDATVSWPSCSITFSLTSCSFHPSSNCH